MALADSGNSTLTVKYLRPRWSKILTLVKISINRNSVYRGILTCALAFSPNSRQERVRYKNPHSSAGPGECYLTAGGVLMIKTADPWFVHSIQKTREKTFKCQKGVCESQCVFLWKNRFKLLFKWYRLPTHVVDGFSKIKEVIWQMFHQRLPHTAMIQPTIGLQC